MDWKHPLVIALLPFALVAGCCPQPDEETCTWLGEQGFADGFTDAQDCAEYGTSFEVPDDLPSSWIQTDNSDTCYQDSYDHAYDMFWGEYCD